MAVLKLVKANNADTVKALAALLERAKRGEVDGVAVCYHTATKREKAVFTGLYRAHPDRAAATAMRLSMALAQLNGEYD